MTNQEEDLKSKFKAAEKETTKQARLKTIAENPELVLSVSIDSLCNTLGENKDITVRELMNALNSKKPSMGDTRLVGDARERAKAAIVEILGNYGGLSCREVSTMVSLPSGKVGALLKQLKDEGRIKSRGNRAATIYFTEQGAS
jgi:sugar-specific transcriptional regulator TrmB